MIRGSTPTFEFTLPFDTDNVVDLCVPFVQNGMLILERNMAECEVDGSVVKVHLTQAETLSFVAGRQAETQIIVKFSDGSIIPSEIGTISVDRTLKDGVI